MVVLLFLLFLASISNGSQINDRPIIGILSQALPPSIENLSPGGAYIASSYIKWVELAGARAIPLIAGSNQNFTQLFESINGVLIPGGAVSLDTSPYSRTGKLMFDLAKAANEAGDYFPIWATCLGFELVTFLSNDEVPNLKSCNSVDQPLPLEFIEGWLGSRMFEQADPEITDIMWTENVTINFHHWCLTMDNFTKFGLDEFWTPLSVNHDSEGLEFISSIEAKNYPFYGTQFHPEKNTFEWTEHYPNIPHTRGAVKVANYFADFFISEARKSSHRFPSRSAEEEYMIYNYSPVYTGGEEINWTFQQAYVFPATQTP